MSGAESLVSKLSAEVPDEALLEAGLTRFEYEEAVKALLIHPSERLKEWREWRAKHPDGRFSMKLSGTVSLDGHAGKLLAFMVYRFVRSGMMGSSMFLKSLIVIGAKVMFREFLQASHSSSLRLSMMQQMAPKSALKVDAFLLLSAARLRKLADKDEFDAMLGDISNRLDEEFFVD